MAHVSERVDLERSKAVLKAKLLGLMPFPGEYPAGFEGFTLFRRDDADKAHQPMLYEPVFIVIAQGVKSVRIGLDEMEYGDNSYFVSGIDMPTCCAIKGISPDYPFLSLLLKLDKILLSQLAGEAPPREGGAMPYTRGAMIAGLDARFIDTIIRLVELVECPDQAGILAPMVIREIHYRLLIGPFGNRLRAITSFGTPANHVAKAILWLKQNYIQPLKVDVLAAKANMGTSTFHKYFKELTAVSPLQYQKRLRLEHAQKLMLSQGHDAATAGMAVGYESRQQFGREYKRLFGQPPRRDVSMKMQ